MKQRNALQYIFQINNLNQADVAYRLSKNRLDRSNITNYCKRKRKIKKEEYIVKLENETGAPREYWLGEDNYTKILTQDLKEKIDLYYYQKIETVDNTIFKETGVHLNESMLVEREFRTKYDDIKYFLDKCIYKKDFDIYILLQRVNLFVRLLKEIDRIGVDNIGKVISELEKYETYIQKPMSKEDLEEYVSLFGEINLGNTSE